MAQSLLLGKTLGNFKPITDAEIEELRKAYF